MRALLALGTVSIVAGLALAAGWLSPMFVGAPTTSLDQATAASGGVTSTGPLGDPSAQVGSVLVWDGPVNGVAFDMSIPAIGYHATVFEGVGNAQLERGPGHYPNTAWPGQAGNVGVAAHNVYWLSFNRLKAGNQVVIQTRHARYVYQVTGSRVVSADDRSILVQNSDQHLLTLTTCYPLWAGAAATKRLVFSAKEIGGVMTSAG